MPVARQRQMPRVARRSREGEFQHVVNRASVRAELFKGPADYELFVELLARAVDKFDLCLLAYCVMPNHWHLVVSTVTVSELSRSMQWLTSVHAMRWSRMHPRRGPGAVYQDRFWSVPVQDGIALHRVVRYVERNGSAAKLAARAEEWRWCSASQRVRNCDHPRLQALTLLPPHEWLRYLNEPTPSPDISAAIRRNLPIGDEAWIRERRRALGLPVSRRPGRPRKEL